VGGEEGGRGKRKEKRREVMRVGDVLNLQRKEQKNKNTELNFLR
jgi:hypothetical protein